jgi:spore coat protein U-like protein
MISSKKKSKILLMKSTTKLTCLVGMLIFCKSAFVGAQTTTSGTFLVSFGISDSCSISADTMAFAPYSGSQITATSAISVDCTSGTDYTVSFNDAANSGSIYYLVKTSGNAAIDSNRLEVTFTNGSSTLTQGVAAFRGTGIGSRAVAGTITGTMAALQTGKLAGTYIKIMTLNVVY